MVERCEIYKNKAGKESSSPVYCFTPYFDSEALACAFAMGYVASRISTDIYGDQFTYRVCER